MANLIVFLEPKPTINMTSGGTTLAITEPKPTVSLTAGLSLQITDLLETISLTGSSPTNGIEIRTPQDVLFINGLTGEIGSLKFSELLPIPSITTKPSILGSLSIIEPLAEILISGTSGVIGSIEITDPLDTLALTAILPAHGVVAIIEPLAAIYLHGLEVPVTYIRKAIVMHLLNYAVTEYKNYNFNSLLRFNGVSLGINEQGVYILDGDDDLGQLIQSRINTGLTDLAKNGVKAIPREAWLAYRSDGMQLDVRVDEVTDLSPMIFEKVAQLIAENREKFDRGIQGRFFTWDLKNISGSDFSIESLRILGDVIKRKTR